MEEKDTEITNENLIEETTEEGKEVSDTILSSNSAEIALQSQSNCGDQNQIEPPCEGNDIQNNLQESNENVVISEEQESLVTTSTEENVDDGDALNQSEGQDLQLSEDEIVAKKKKRIIDTVWYVFFALVLIITISTCCSVIMFDSYDVKGGSMKNTVYSGDRVTVCVWDKAKYYDVKVGDVVVLKSPTYDADETLLIKRVIVKGPAYVKIDTEGNVYVDKENDSEGYVKLDEPYLSEENKCRVYDTLKPGLRYEDENGYYVAEGKIFYMGDNRAGSTDSRAKGAVDQSLIIGKVSDYFLVRKNTKFYKFLTTNYVDVVKKSMINFFDNIKRKCK